MNLLDQLLDETDLGPDTLADLLDTFATALDQRFQQSARVPNADRLGLLEWGRTMLAEHFSRPPSLMHRWLGQRLDALRHDRGRRINLIGPRGAAKSTIGTLAYVLRAAVEHREPYIWIVSDTRHQAQSHLQNVKAELTENHVLAQTYPAAVGAGPVWRSDAVVLNNGVMIEAFGTGQRIRGRRRRAHRPTLIVCDDLQNDDHMQSATLREQSQRWFEGTLLKAGTKRTNIVNLATALHRDALALRLHRTPGWTSRKFRAIERWPDNQELWDEWERIYCNVENAEHQSRARLFYEQHRKAMQAGAELLWPEEEDLYTLMCMRVEGGRTAFEREKQGSPVDPDVCEWPEEYFGPHAWFDDWPDALAVRTIALDPSKGADARRGDYSALVTLGIDATGIVYVEADLARRPIAQLVSDGVALCGAFRPHVFGIETNQFQELLAGEFEAEFHRQQVVGIPIASLTNTVNKQVRIRRLGPYLSSGRLRFKANSPSTRLLVDQMRDFPAGAHDDGPDAAEMALRLALEFVGNDRADDGLGSRLPLELR